MSVCAGELWGNSYMFFYGYPEACVDMGLHTCLSRHVLIWLEWWPIYLIPGFGSLMKPFMFALNILLHSALSLSLSPLSPFALSFSLSLHPSPSNTIGTFEGWALAHHLEERYYPLALLYTNHGNQRCNIFPSRQGISNRSGSPHANAVPFSGQTHHGIDGVRAPMCFLWGLWNLMSWFFLQRLAPFGSEHGFDALEVVNGCNWTLGEMRFQTWSYHQAGFMILLGVTSIIRYNWYNFKLELPVCWRWKKFQGSKTVNLFRRALELQRYSFHKRLGKFIIHLGDFGHWHPIPHFLSEMWEAVCLMPCYWAGRTCGWWAFETAARDLRTGGKILEAFDPLKNDDRKVSCWWIFFETCLGDTEHMAIFLEEF